MSKEKVRSLNLLLIKLSFSNFLNDVDTFNTNMLLAK